MDNAFDGQLNISVVGQQYGRIQCKFCKRQFNREALVRHQPVCSRMTHKQRRVFDSFKQRAKGTGITTVRKRPEPQVKKSNWRQKHQELVRAVRAARGVQVAIKRGDPLPPPPAPYINPDYIQCKYCGRRFNETAAQRHIAFCKEQQERLPRNKPISKPVPRAPNQTFSTARPSSRFSVGRGQALRTGRTPETYAEGKLIREMQNLRTTPAKRMMNESFPRSHRQYDVRTQNNAGRERHRAQPIEEYHDWYGGRPQFDSRYHYPNYAVVEDYPGRHPLPRNAWGPTGAATHQRPRYVHEFEPPRYRQPYYYR